MRGAKREVGVGGLFFLLLCFVLDFLDGRLEGSIGDEGGDGREEEGGREGRRR